MIKFSKQLSFSSFTSSFVMATLLLVIACCLHLQINNNNNNQVLAESPSNKNNNNNMNSPPPSTFCGSNLNEPDHKNSFQELLSNRVHPSNKAKIWEFSTSLPSNSAFGRGASTTSCTITDVDAIKTLPIYSLQHLGLAPSPSPLYSASYRNKEQEFSRGNSNNNYQQSAFRAADRFFIWIEDRVPFVGFAVKGLRLSVAVVITHGGSLINAIQVAVSNKASPETFSKMNNVIAPQTSHLLKFVNILDDAVRFALFRQVIDVYVEETTSNGNGGGGRKDITLADGTVDIFAVSTNSNNNQQCSDIKSAYEVKNIQGPSRSIHCRDPSSIAILDGMTEFVNSVFAWIPKTFYKYVIIKAGGPSVREADLPRPTCTIDTTLHSAETAPQCVFVVCKNREKCSLKPFNVHFEQRVEIDIAVFVLLAAAIVSGFLRPYASRSAVLRWTLCTLAGILVLIILLTLFLYRLFENNSNSSMKFGFVAFAGFSGLYAASQGLISYVVGTIFELIVSNAVAAAAFAALCLISVYMAHRFFGSSMPLIIDITMSFGEWFFFAAAALRNIELVAVIYINYYILKYVVFYGILKFILVSIFGSAVSGFFSGESADSIPRDSFPAHVYKLVEHQVPSRALANRIGWGQTPEARNKSFVQQGNNYTQQQLNLLYRELRKNPTKYANRLQNPNLVFRQAGVGEEDEE